MISKDRNFSSYNYYSIPRVLHGQILFQLDNPDPNPVERITISNPKNLNIWRIGLQNRDPVHFCCNAHCSSLQSSKHHIQCATWNVFVSFCHEVKVCTPNASFFPLFVLLFTQRYGIAQVCAPIATDWEVLWCGVDYGRWRCNHGSRLHSCCSIRNPQIMDWKWKYWPQRENSCTLSVCVCLGLGIVFKDYCSKMKYIGCWLFLFWLFSHISM